MKIRYIGKHPEVRFMGMVFERGKEYNITPTFKVDFPADFEVDGRPIGLHTEESLKKLSRKMGWRKFQDWAFEKFGVKDTSKAELIREILKKQEIG